MRHLKTLGLAGFVGLVPNANGAEHKMGLEFEGFFWSDSSTVIDAEDNESKTTDAYFAIDRLRMRLQGKKNEKTKYELRLRFDRDSDIDGNGVNNLVDNAYVLHQYNDLVGVKIGKYDSYHAYMTNDVYGDWLVGHPQGSGAIGKNSGLTTFLYPSPMATLALTIANSTERDADASISGENPLIGITALGNFGTTTAFLSYYIDQRVAREYRVAETEELRKRDKSQNSHITLGAIYEDDGLGVGLQLGNAIIAEWDSRSVGGETTVTAPATTVNDLVLHLEHTVAGFYRSSLELGTAKATTEAPEGGKQSVEDLLEYAFQFNYYLDEEFSYELGLIGQSQRQSLGTVTTEANSQRAYVGFTYYGSFDI